MEDVLDIYSRLSTDNNFDPLSAIRPEISGALHGRIEHVINWRVHEPIAAAPGHPVLMYDEYIRKGVANIFIEVEPLGGRRKVKITATRKRIDCIEKMRANSALRRHR